MPYISEFTEYKYPRKGGKTAGHELTNKKNCFRNSIV